MAAFVYEGVLLFGVLAIAGYLYSSLTQQRHALHGLAGLQAFLFVVLAIYFTWQMAVAALVALVHDIVITIGVYSILQFEVTPSTPSCSTGAKNAVALWFWMVSSMPRAASCCCRTSCVRSR